MVNPDGAILPLGVAAAPAAAKEQAARAAAPVAVVARDEDAALLAALRHAMEHDRLYRAEGLSIGSLATRLGTPEHRLRRLINRQLGHRIAPTRCDRCGGRLASGLALYAPRPRARPGLPMAS